jgi:hypothetical protein
MLMHVDLMIYSLAIYRRAGASSTLHRCLDLVLQLLWPPKRYKISSKASQSDLGGVLNLAFGFLYYIAILKCCVNKGMSRLSAI